MPERRNLNYASTADVAADIRRLRDAGYDKCGQWSLPQACHHLNVTCRFVMSPAEPQANTPEQDGRRPMLARVMETGKLPPGIEAPEAVRPPADAPESAVDDLLATLAAFERFPGPFRPHRLFGNLSHAEMRRLTLIHAAHHLSHLVPRDGAAAAAAAAAR